MKKLTAFFYSIFLILLTIFSPLAAQNRIHGTVSDKSGAPLTNATVLLKDSSTDKLIKGGITNPDGTYLLENLKPGNYFLEIEFLGFETFRYATFRLIQATNKKDMGNLKLKEATAQLNEVIVREERLPFVQKIDRLEINVANTTVFSGISALEVLERSPGVIVDRQNNGISISGKSGVVVMINNRINYMSASAVVQLLAGMSADNIEKIELITTPPAGFDAEGNAGFINIVLKSNPNDGLSGSYSLSAGYGKGETGAANVNFNYRQGKFNLYGDYSYLRNAQDQTFSMVRSAVLEDDFNETATSSLRAPLQRNHNGRLGVDIQLSDKTIIGGLISSYDTKWTMDAFNTANISTNGTLQELIEIVSDEKNQWHHYGGNFNVQHTFKEGETLSFDADFLYYRDNNPTTYLNSYFDGNGALDYMENTRSGKITPIKIGVAKMDYGRNLGEKVKMTTGLKGTVSSFTNDVSVEALMGQSWVPDTDLTAKYDLQEKILAAYADLDVQLDEKTSAKIGLRYEFTDSNLSTAENENIVDRQYGRFFPSVFLSRTLNEQNAINLSYSRRITRPTFNDMAPFVLFIDPTTFFSGNPALQPAFSNNFKVDYRLKSTLISLQYSHEDNTIAKFQSRIIPGTNDQLIYAENLQSQKTASLTVSMPFSPAPWWNMFINASGVWQRAGIYYEDIIHHAELKSVNIFSSQSFSLPKDFTLEISGFYNSGSLFGSFLMDSFGAVNAGLQKKFKGNSSTLRVGVDNIFNTMVWKMSADIPELQQTFDGRFQFAQPTVKVSFSQSFGNGKMKSQRKRKIGSEEERQRVND